MLEIREERVRAGGTFLTTEYVVLQDGREVGRYGVRSAAEDRVARLNAGVMGLNHSMPWRSWSASQCEFCGKRCNLDCPNYQEPNP